MMVDQPQLVLRLSGRTDDAGAVRIEAPDAFCQRMRQVLTRFTKLSPQAALPERMALVSGLPLHSGLGAGTQTACATAAALHVFARHQLQEQQPRELASLQALSGIADAQELARWSGRGLRSAIGLQGFLAGGLLLDRGLPKPSPPQRERSTRQVQVDTAAFPAEWSVVLLKPQAPHPICGREESALLAELARQPNPHRAKMQARAEEVLQIARAAMPSDPSNCFDDFVRALERYLEMAADLFAPLQQGAYNGPQVEAAVERARAAGLRAVGQSSWGPTVFGLAPNHDVAHAARQRLLQHYGEQECWLAKALSPGAAQARFPQLYRSCSID